LWSYAFRAPDLDIALGGLAVERVKVLGRAVGIAWTDPATTLGVPLEWTDSVPTANWVATAERTFAPGKGSPPGPYSVYDAAHP
jgi:hypothetical protein